MFTAYIVWQIDSVHVVSAYHSYSTWTLIEVYMYNTCSWMTCMWNRQRYLLSSFSSSDFFSCKNKLLKATKNDGYSLFYQCDTSIQNLHVYTVKVYTSTCIIHM